MFRGYGSKTLVSDQGIKNSLLFLFKVSENPDRKSWLVYSGIIICPSLFLEVIAKATDLDKIRNRSCLLEFRAHQKLYFLYKKKLVTL